METTLRSEYRGGKKVANEKKEILEGERVPPSPLSYLDRNKLGGEKEKMNVTVYVEVVNFGPRTYLQLSGPVVPNNEIGRIIHFESGGDIPQLGPNIYDILSEREQDRIYAACGMIGTSGHRGSMQVQVRKDRLLERLKKM